VLSAIINGKIASTYGPKITAAVVGAGLPKSSVAELITAIKSGKQAAINAVPGINPAIISTAINTSHEVYARAYRLAFASIIPFVVLAIVASSFLHGVKELMTEHVEAPVEKIAVDKTVDA